MRRMFWVLIAVFAMAMFVGCGKVEEKKAEPEAKPAVEAPAEEKKVEEAPKTEEAPAAAAEEKKE